MLVLCLGRVIEYVKSTIVLFKGKYPALMAVVRCGERQIRSIPSQKDLTTRKVHVPPGSSHR
jgi:hypothetical protein